MSIIYFMLALGALASIWNAILQTMWYYRDENKQENGEK